jgi:hypothetical protein
MTSKLPKPIEMPPLVGQLAEIWRALVQLAEAAGELRWTVVGGQMVMLHGLEHGTTPNRISNGIDAAVDVRADPHAVAKLVRVLTSLGFENAGVSPDGHAYRYRRGGAAHLTIDVMVDQPEPTDLIVDVLVPDNLGEHANIRTVGHATAFPAPGVHQALQRTERVAISIEGPSRSSLDQACSARSSPKPPHAPSTTATPTATTPTLPSSADSSATPSKWRPTSPAPIAGDSPAPPKSSPRATRPGATIPTRSPP